MVAEVLFAGGRLDSVAVTLGTPTETTGGYRTAFADAAIECDNASHAFDVGLFVDTSGVLSATTVVSGESVWFHCDLYVGGSTTGAAPVTFYDSSGFPWVRLEMTASYTLRLKYNSGTGASPTWTDVASVDVGVANITLFTFDFCVTLGSPHYASVSVNGNLIASGNFTQALFTNVAKIKCTAGFTGAGGRWVFSQLLATRDIATPGARVKTLRPTAAGANTGFSGAYTDVNEAINSDATVQTAASAGLKTTHAMADYTIPAGMTLKTIFHWMRAKNDGAAPMNLKSVLRSGGADYSTGNLAGIGTSFAAIGARYNTDPATSAAWGQTGLNAVEAGYEAAT